MYLNPKKLGNFVDVAQCVIYAVEIHIGLHGSPTLAISWPAFLKFMKVFLASPQI